MMLTQVPPGSDYTAEDAVRSVVYGALCAVLILLVSILLPWPRHPAAPVLPYVPRVPTTCKKRHRPDRAGWILQRIPQLCQLLRAGRE